MEQQGTATAPSKTPLAEQATDLAAVQAALQAHVQQLQQLVPAAALIDSESKLELLEQLQESLTSAQALVDAVAEQQQLTGRDPLTSAAVAAAVAHAPWSYEEDDDTVDGLSPASKGAAEHTVTAASDDSESESEDQGGTAEAYGELSAAGRQQLLAVLGVADALDRSQVGAPGTVDAAVSVAEKQQQLSGHAMLHVHAACWSVCGSVARQLCMASSWCCWLCSMCCVVLPY
jgi:hypothetical protein